MWIIPKAITIAAGAQVEPGVGCEGFSPSERAEARTTNQGPRPQAGGGRTSVCVVERRCSRLGEMANGPVQKTG